MFLQRLSKTIRLSHVTRRVPLVITRRSLITLPDTKEADIVPLLNTVETKTTDSYNSILSQLAHQGRSLQAQSLYDRIFRHHELAADMTTYSQLMLAYINDGKYEDAMEIYYQLRDHEDTSLKPATLRLDTSTYETMIASLTRETPTHQPRFDRHAEPHYVYTVEDTSSYIYPDVEGESQPALLTALTLFNDMRQLDIQPTPAMYVHMLRACAEQKDGYVLDKVHKLIRVDVYLDPRVEVLNGLMKAYQAIGEGSTVLELWDIAESYDDTSVSIVLKTCLDHGYDSRADAVWHGLKSQHKKCSVENFNCYLKSVLKRQQIEKAKELVEEALITGEADDTSKALISIE